MSFGSPTSDAQLNNFIEGQSQRQKFQALVHDLNDKCWDTCMTSKPGTKLDSRTSTCIVSCVERFIDSSNFVLNRVAALPQQPSGGSSYE